MTKPTLKAKSLLLVLVILASSLFISPIAKGEVKEASAASNSYITVNVVYDEASENNLRLDVTIKKYGTFFTYFFCRFEGLFKFELFSGATYSVMYRYGSSYYSHSRPASSINFSSSGFTFREMGKLVGSSTSYYFQPNEAYTIIVEYTNSAGTVINYTSSLQFVYTTDEQINIKTYSNSSVSTDNLVPYGTLFNTIPTRQGYSFLGWYTDELYTTSIPLPYLTVKNITLYAKWQENQYTIKFYVNGVLYTTAKVNNGAVLTNISTP